jgi:hypothetical protein
MWWKKAWRSFRMAMNSSNRTKELLHIKVIATSSLDNIQPLLDIKDSWQADEQDIMDKACSVGLKYELALTELRVIINMTDRILNDPPAYGDAHQLEHTFYLRCMELEYHCLRSSIFCEEARDLIEDLDEMATEANYDDEGIMTLTEARLRAGDMVNELDEMDSEARAIVDRMRKEQFGG